MKYRVQLPVTILLPVNNFKPVIILELGGSRRPGLYADITVPVLQVLAREEGGPGGIPNLLKEEEKYEDKEEKKENEEEVEDVEGKRRDEKDMQDIV